MHGPDTRASLIANLSDQASQEAWREFDAIYRPLVIRVAVAQGLQHSDAEDLAQDVFTRVERAVSSFVSTGEGSFRGWLYQITRNLVVNHLTRGSFSGNRGPIASGDTDVQRMLTQQPAPENETATLFRLEYRRARFQQAAAAVRNQFSDSTWQCFWLTATEGRSLESIAEELDKSNGAVRVARCRVLAAIRDYIQDNDQGSEW